MALREYENNNETVMVAPAGGFYSDQNWEKASAYRLCFEEEDLRRSVELLRCSSKI